MTTSQEDDGKQEGNPEPILEAEDKSDNIKAKEYLEDEENENILKKISSLNLWLPWKRLSVWKRKTRNLRRKH